MDHLLAHIETLEHRTHALERHARRVARQLRWWRGLTCSVLGVALLTWALPSSKAAEAPPGLLADRVAALQDTLTALQEKLRHVTAVTTQDGRPEVVITGANLRIVNGLGSTDCLDDQGNAIPDCPNGLGNLIVGYNEPRPEGSGENMRTGSHNVVVGSWHNYSSFGGLVVGEYNTISGAFSSVSAGFANVASGQYASVSGGTHNGATRYGAAVSGGVTNTASGDYAAVSGGNTNWASGDYAAVSGGFFNTAGGDLAAVSGGQGNTASGRFSSISGGFNRTAAGEFDWVAGPLFADE
jgi:hypothetical protein